MYKLRMTYLNQDLKNGMERGWYWSVLSRGGDIDTMYIRYLPGSYGEHVHSAYVLPTEVLDSLNNTFHKHAYEFVRLYL